MYRGICQTIDFGIGGLHTDDPNTQIPVTDLIRATNISYEGTRVTKAPGSHKFNQTALSAGIVGAYDWFPDPITQRCIAITRDGLVYRMPDGYNQSVIPPFADTLQTNLQVTNQVTLVAGGAESGTAARKLFILSGSNPIQVIKGDAVTRYNMSMPSADWTGQNQPTAGIIHHGRLWCWGNLNNPHGLYASNPDNHEDFQTFSGASLNFTVYPGEFEGILGCFVFKGRMFIYKYPFGVYYLDDSNSDYTLWQILKYTDNFGIASSHSAITVLNDLIVANAYGSITSYNAVQYYGGFDMADVLQNTRNFAYVRENIAINGNADRHAIYYENKKQAFFAYRSTSGLLNDRILFIDYSGTNPKVAWWDKDQANCLFMRKDVNLIQRPAYGSEDGFIYLMDQEDRDVGGKAYQSDFMTPHMDLGQDQTSITALPRQLAEVNKLFDFLELTFNATGKWNLNVDVFIDGKFSETIHFPMSKFRGTNEVMTNIDRTYDGAPLQVRKNLHGTGKRIALRFYNNGLQENFELLRAQIYFRPGSQGEKADS